MLDPLLIRFLIVAIALIGLLLFLMALRRLWGRRLISGTLEGLTGLLLLALSILAGALFINLLTYDRLTVRDWLPRSVSRRAPPALLGLCGSR